MRTCRELATVSADVEMRQIVGLAVVVVAVALFWPSGLAVGGGVEGPTALIAGGGSIWVADTSGAVQRIDAHTGRRVAGAQVDGYPGSLAVDRRSVWVSTVQPGAVVRISRTTNRRIGPPLQVGSGEPIHLSVRRGTLWVVNAQDDRVWRIATSRGRVEGSTVVSPEPWLTATVVAEGGGAWVAFSDVETSSTLVRLDARGRIVARRTFYGIEIGTLAIDGDVLLALGGPEGRLLRLSSDTGAPTAPTIQVGRYPVAIAIDRGAVWVSSLDERAALRKIDLRTGRRLLGPLRALGRSGRADDLAVAGDDLWATNAYGILSRLDA